LSDVPPATLPAAQPPANNHPAVTIAESPSKITTAAVPTPRANRVWAWFTGGNTLTRIGVVVLFFGVAFLLRYFAEHFTIPIEARLGASPRWASR
jgi:uncharacterized membrane protein